MSSVTIEQIVRARLSAALGGTRGIVEAALPTLVFTISWITWRDLNISLIASITIAVLAVAARVLQKQTTQFVFNAAFGIAIAAIFAWRSGDARDAFLPGIIYNGIDAAVMVFSIMIRKPLMGFLIAAASSEFNDWTSDRALVKLAARLTWILAIPCIIRVAIQFPLYQADYAAALGLSKILLGWPLQIAALFAMVWVLRRDSIPAER